MRKFTKSGYPFPEKSNPDSNEEPETTNEKQAKQRLVVNYYNEQDTIKPVKCNTKTDTAHKTLANSIGEPEAI